MNRPLSLLSGLYSGVVPVFLVLAPVVFLPNLLGIELDNVFGDGGVVRPVFAASPSQDEVGLGATMVSLPDGSTVVACKTSADGDVELALLRYTPEGVLDTTFGVQGVVVIRRPGSQDIPTALKVLGDGRFVIVGHSTSAAGQDMLVVRLMANGARDPTFGTAGVTQIDFGGQDDVAYDVAVDALGRILVTGSSTSGAGDLALARLLSDGSLDSDFGNGGVLTESLGISNEEGHAVVVQANGSIVVAGFSRLSNNDAFFLCRYFADGSLDETFGGSGKIATQLSNQEDRAMSIIVQSGGRIVVAGWSTGSDVDFALVRYLANGDIDSAFGVGGIVTTDFGSTDDYAYSLREDSNGSLVMAGTSLATTGAVAVARYSVDGVLDASFATGGKEKVDFPSADVEAFALVLQADDKILVAGTVIVLSEADIGLIRLGADGGLDGDFGQSGRVVTDLKLTTPQSSARAVHALPDGKILMAGGVLVGGGFQFGVMRFLPSAEPDATFGDGGLALASVGPDGGFPFALLVQGDGKILLAGQRSNFGVYEFALVRFLAGGVLDPTFGTNGFVATSVGEADSEIYAMCQQTDGKIVVAGYGYPTADPNIDLAIVRYDNDGVLDPTFGTSGVFMTSIAGAGDDIATGVAVQPDGKIVASGTRFPSSGSSQFAIVRVSPLGVLDSSFGTGGKRASTLPGGNAQAQSLLALESGGFIVAGTAGVFGDAEFACGKYDSSGSLDGTFGTSGIAVVSLGSFVDYGYDVVEDSSGRLLMVGTKFGSSGELALVRLTENGLLDTTFGVSGVAAFDLGPAADVAYAAAYQPDGRLLVAGDSGQRMALARFLIPTPNQDPVAADDLWYAIPGVSVLIPVLANDADGDTDPLSISGFTQPASGGAVGQEGDSLRFTPNGTFAGSTFTYQVSDGQGGSDGATVTVSPVTLFGHWQVARFGLDAGNPAVTGELQDPDFDRIPNLLEYAFALNPLVAESDPPVSARIDSGRLVLTVRRWIGATDLQVQGMFCEDLLGWSNAGVTVSEVSSDGFVATDEHTGPLPGDLRQFGQIEVTK